MYRDTRPPFKNGLTIKTTKDHIYRVDNKALETLILNSLNISSEDQKRARVIIYDRNRNTDGPSDYVVEVTVTHVQEAEFPYEDNDAARRCVAAIKDTTEQQRRSDLY